MQLHLFDTHSADQWSQSPVMRQALIGGEEGAVMLTGTWLDRAKPPARLFFLLLLLATPPPLMVLPPDTFRFLRLLGACLVGSAEETAEINQSDSPLGFLHCHRIGSSI